MAGEIPLLRSSLPSLFSGANRLKPIEALIPHFYFGVLEGLGFRTLEGASSHGALNFDYATAMVRYDADSITLLQNERAERRAYRESDSGVGVVEWAQVYAPNGHVAFASVPDAKGHAQMLFYADHEEAPLRMHEDLDALRLSFRRNPGPARRRRAAFGAVALGLTMTLLAFSTAASESAMQVLDDGVGGSMYGCIECEA